MPGRTQAHWSAPGCRRSREAAARRSPGSRRPSCAPRQQRADQQASWRRRQPGLRRRPCRPATGTGRTAGRPSRRSASPTSGALPARTPTTAPVWSCGPTRRSASHLDHWTGDQWNEGAHIPLSALRPGDLLFFATDTSDPNTIHHVGMYVGNGQMVEAPVHRRERPLQRRVPRRTSSARSASSTVDAANVRAVTPHPRRRHLRRAQQRARDLVRDGRQRARGARPRPLRRRADRHHH